jgi:hypothetical protein
MKKRVLYELLLGTAVLITILMKFAFNVKTVIYTAFLLSLLSMFYFLQIFISRKIYKSCFISSIIGNMAFSTAVIGWLLRYINVDGATFLLTLSLGPMFFLALYLKISSSDSEEKEYYVKEQIIRIIAIICISLFAYASYFYQVLR